MEEEGRRAGGEGLKMRIRIWVRMRFYFRGARFSVLALMGFGLEFIGLMLVE